MARVLLVAPSNGADIGELWVGYQWARHLAEHHDVTLLSYHKKGALPASGQLPSVRVIEWQDPPLLDKFERFNSLLKPGYIAFYQRARRWIRDALAAGERFDVAHQPVPVAIRYPSPLRGLGLPYVVGPVGGSLDSPAGFASQDSGEPWYLKLRRADDFRLRFDPLLRSTYEDADCVLGIAPYVSDELKALSLKRFEVMSETGLVSLPPMPERTFALPREDAPLRLVFVGRLIRTKGLRDAVTAMAQLRDLPVVLDVIGDGFDRAACEQTAGALGVADRVRFHGRLPREAVDEHYRTADIFLFPSYREPGGNAIFEAMGFGLPSIVSDRGGPASSTDEACAIRLAPVDPRQYAAAIASAVRELAGDPERRERMSQAARARVEAVGLWDAKVARMSEIYESVMRPN